jgi:hypothetical protein
MADRLTAKVYRLPPDHRRGPAPFFDRTELNQLLSLYSRHVACGQWRDYAIDQRQGSAVFSVFRHTHDAPLFRIAKRIGRGGRRSEFIVQSGRETLKRASTMSEALSVFRQPLRIVS